MIKNVLAIYHWFRRQALTGSRAAAPGQGNRLSPDELGVLAKRLASASDPADVAETKERLTRGFYGI